MPSQSRRLFTVICVLVVCAMIPEFIDRSGTIVFAQEAGVAPRTVELEISFSKGMQTRFGKVIEEDPAKIVRVMYRNVEVKAKRQGNAEVKPDVPFLAGDDWFNDLSVVVKNLSSKKIVFAGIQVNFPQTGDGRIHPIVGDQSSVGQTPEHGMYSAITGRKLTEPVRDPILLEPGAEVTIPVINRDPDNDHRSSVTAMLEAKLPLSKVTTCLVGLAEFYFEDGTRWSHGVYYRPKPGAPGKFIVIPIEEFNGHPTKEDSQ
jgi:hypothetical protein